MQEQQLKELVDGQVNLIARVDGLCRAVERLIALVEGLARQDSG